MLRYTSAGYLFLLPEDDADHMADALISAAYPEEFCLSVHFEPPFIAALMAAGFLVMSSQYDPERTLLLPKMHLRRAVLDFKDLHESQTARRRLGRYELRPQADFPRILERCTSVHGEDWLTPPLRASLLDLWQSTREVAGPRSVAACPLSFGLYRDGHLVAGEFGVSAGGVYTSYSGYRDENSAGTVQLILTARSLQAAGYSFWDLGMPMGYKEGLGARTLDRAGFIARFRSARTVQPRFPESPPAP